MATATNEFSGKIYKGQNYWTYESYYDGYTFCHDLTDAYGECEMGQTLGKFCPPSWGGGVVDRGAYRMALVMLGLTANGGWDTHRKTVNRYYKQFAKEVVAHLPDNWSMSKAEILKWIEKKEKKRKKNR